MAEVRNEVTDSTGHFDIRELLKQTVEGKDPEQVAYGTSGRIDDSAAREFDEETSDSPLESLENDVAEELSKDSQSEREPSLLDSLDSDSELPAKSADIETVRLKIRDPKTGRPQKLEIDYTDREKIKQAFVKAAGMRKFQQERDTIKKDLTSIQSKYDELNEVYSALDKAFQESGVKGVVALLGKGEDAWQKAVDEELTHRNYLKGLTPSEKYRMEMEKKQEQYEKQIAMERQKREEFEKKISEREEQASLNDLKSKINPSFDRYRFQGKLGDPIVEEQLDEAIWTKVMSRLEEYPDTIELSQAIIDKEFRTVASNFRKVINEQSEKKVQKTIERKKADATQRAQVTAKKGLSSNSDKRKFVEDMKSGNIKDAFSAMFTGKVKL